jgi:hypothetical protein
LVRSNRIAALDTVKHLNADELMAGLPGILESPADSGTVDMIVRRPGIDEREIVDSCELSLEDGLGGDNWKTRGSLKRIPRPPSLENQLTLMNSRAIGLIAGPRDRWPLAGDQFFVDLDLGDDNAPPGTQLRIGTAIVEVTGMPHLGCKKFVQRFGKDAMEYVNSETGRNHNLRGVNAKVVRGGTVTTGDTIHKTG